LPEDILDIAAAALLGDPLAGLSIAIPARSQTPSMAATIRGKQGGAIQISADHR